MSTSSTSAESRPLSTKFHIPFHHISVVKLTEHNYLMWKQQVLAGVKGHGLEGFITGKKECPPEFLTNTTEGEGNINPEFDLWNKHDQLLASWLLGSISESLLTSIVGLSTSKEIWDRLESDFSNQSRAKIMHYKQQLQNIKKGALSMRDYLSKIKGCCDILNASGHRVDDEDHLLYIMSGLGAEYNPVMGSISTRYEAISVSEISSLLLTFEARLETVMKSSFSTEGSGPSVNFTTQGNKPHFNTGFGRGNNNNIRGGRGPFRGGFARGRGGGRFNSNGPRCQICHRNNHTADKS